MIDKLLFFAVAVYFFYQGFFFPPTLPGLQSAVFWPRVLALSMMVICFFPKKFFVVAFDPNPTADKPVTQTIIVCVYYMLAWYFLGFIFATLTSVFLFMILLRPGKRKIVSAMSYAVAYFVVVYLFFRIGMRVPL